MPTPRQRQRDPLLLARMRRSLVASYEFEEASGNRLDGTGRGNDLVPTNTPGNAGGRSGNALQLVRTSSQYLTIADNADLSMGDIDFTVAANVYLDTKPAAGVVACRWDDSNNKREYWLGYLGGGTDRFAGFISPDGSATQTQVTANTFGAPSTATWYALILSYDAAKDVFSISVGGGPADTASASGGAFDSTVAFAVGCQRPPAASPVNFFDGRIDRLRIWKRLLTPVEQVYIASGG